MILSKEKVVSGSEVQVSDGSGLFDQLSLKPDFLKENFKSDKWVRTINAFRESVIERLFPASESGVRNMAVQVFAESAGLDVIMVPGSDRELTWSQYLQVTSREPDLIEYQGLVARSKHDRRRRMSERELEERGVYSDSQIERKTAELAFDTIIMVWDGNQYIKIEKPESESEALQTIISLTEGTPFVVSTVARAQSLMNSGELATAATLIPIKISTKDRFEKAELQSKWIGLYKQIMRGEGKPWKLTPAGGPSLMHPLIQPFLEVAASPDLDGNVLPADFGTFEFVETVGQPNPTYVWRNTGPHAYKKFADQLGNVNRYRSMTQLPPELRQKVGMAVSGYSDSGMREALSRYVAKVGKVGYSPISRLRDGKFMEVLQMVEQI